MNKRRTKPLIRLLSSRWAKTSLMVVFAALVAVGAQAQATEGGGTQPPRDENSVLRTRTWSIYAHSGLSWATDVWYPSINAKKSYSLAPVAGGGIDFTIRPWVRVGAEYLWSRYRREQRMSVLDTKTMPVKAYGSYLMNYHNAKLGLQFNFMELWSARRAQWLNIWIGTGVGYTFARGNEYAITFSNTQTQNGQTQPIGSGATVGNESSVTITGNVRSANRHERFNTLYVPASLHFEADVSRRFTIGLKGEMDWLFNRKDIAPKNLVFALAALRYNFVPSRAQVLRAFYEGEIASLNERVNTLRDERGAAEARASREDAAKSKALREKADLERRLADCERRPQPESSLTYLVLFDHDKADMSREEVRKLRVFARSVKGRKLSLTAEASTPGDDAYNQRLSERRLQRVVMVLKSEGIATADIDPQTAIGSRNGIATADGRRVTVRVTYR